MAPEPPKYQEGLDDDEATTLERDPSGRFSRYNQIVGIPGASRRCPRPGTTRKGWTWCVVDSFSRHVIGWCGKKHPP